MVLGSFIFPIYFSSFIFCSLSFILDSLQAAFLGPQIFYLLSWNLCRQPSLVLRFFLSFIFYLLSFFWNVCRQPYSVPRSFIFYLLCLIFYLLSIILESLQAAFLGPQIFFIFYLGGSLPGSSVISSFIFYLLS